MTVGQRILQKRKEAGLSQEALGEMLGVSRQAIYKWESDSTLPEIEKLVALSRIFSVTVGWLLGVEEEPAPDQSGGELTETQLKMVEEIVARYLAAQPEPAPLKRRRRPFVLLAGGVVALAVVFVSLFSRLDRLGQQYDYIQNSVANVSSSVNSQIYSITGRVEEILKGQNNLTASYGAELTATDPSQNTATFALRATPKTYTEGMTAVFVANNGGDTVEVPGEMRPGPEFFAEVTCGVTDDITLSVVFVTGDQRETQVLDQYSMLYSASFPDLWLSGPLWFDVMDDGTLEPNAAVNISSGGMDFDTQTARVQVGLFCDQKLVCWYEPEIKKRWVNDRQEDQLCYVRREEIALEPGHTYCDAAVYTDEYGRQRVYSGVPMEYDEAEGRWLPVDTYTGSSETKGWEF